MSDAQREAKRARKALLAQKAEADRIGRSTAEAARKAADRAKKKAKKARKRLERSLAIAVEPIAADEALAALLESEHLRL